MMDLQRVNAYMSKVEESEKKVLPHEGKRLKTGLDLGTAYIVLVVLDENDQPVACEKQASRWCSCRLQRGMQDCPGTEGKAGGASGRGAH